MTGTLGKRYHRRADGQKCSSLRAAWSQLKQSLLFIASGAINTKLVLVRAMTWHQTCINPLPEPIMTQVSSDPNVLALISCLDSWRVLRYHSHTFFDFHMMTSWYGNALHITGLLWVNGVSHMWIPLTNCQGCKTMMFLSLYTRIRFSTNSQVVGDLEHHDAHVITLQTENTSCLEIDMWCHCLPLKLNGLPSSVRCF